MSPNTNGHERFNGWRTEPMYSFSEAAHLAHVSAGTVRNWLFGYTAKEREVQPLFKTPAGQGPMASFVQLVEIVVTARFRKAERVSFRRVRLAYDNAKRLSGLDHPFAHLRLQALGGHIIGRLRDEAPGTSLQALDEPAQWTLPGVVLDTIHQLEYEGALAARWFPVGKDIPIVVDPRISSGIPTVVERGVTIQTLRKRWKAGHRIDFIAKDLALEPDLVEKVLQYAEQVAA